MGDDGDDDEDASALEVSIDVDILPSSPHKLRLQRLDPGLQGSSVGAGAMYADVPTLHCGDVLTLALNVEDEFRNPVFRFQWARLGSSDDRAHGWRLPLSKAFTPINLLALAPALFLKADGVGDSGEGGAGVTELTPKAVTETAFGWDVEGVILMGSADGRVHKLIARDRSGLLKASNIHLQFVPGFAHRIVLDGRVVWEAAGISTAMSCARGGTTNSADQRHFIFRNGERASTRRLAIIDCFGNSVLAVANPHARRGKKVSLGESVKVMLRASHGRERASLSVSRKGRDDKSSDSTGRQSCTFSLHGTTYLAWR